MTTRKRKRKNNVWDSDKLDPLMLEYLKAYHHNIDRTVCPIKHTFVLKEDVSQERIEELTKVLVPAIRHLIESTLRAYRVCDNNDIPKMIDDLVVDVLNAFRIYFKPGKGKPFTYLVWLAKTRFSHYYKGLLPSSSLYDKKVHNVQIIKTDDYLDEMQKEALVEMYEELRVESNDPDVYVHVNKSTVSLRRKTRTQHVSDNVLLFQEATEDMELVDDLDFDELKNYIPDVQAAFFHKKIAYIILDQAQNVAAGGSFDQGRRSIHVALKAIIQKEVRTDVKVADIKLAIYVIRRALEMYHADNPSFTNLEETKMINRIMYKKEDVNDDFIPV